ncbi:MAG: S1/P1 nuclease [Flavobacteriaceae bacterium]
MLFHYLFSYVFSVVLSGTLAADWGQTGHRVVGAIADAHLTRTARKQINQLLDGQSLALVSTYADEIKSDSLYDAYKPWHYINIPFTETYAGQATSTKGDLAQGITYCLKQLKNPRNPKEARAFYLKLLVHLVGDLHQPLHIGKSEDRGGNRFWVKWFGRKSNLHRVWDSQLIDSYQMSYSEITQNRASLSHTQIENIQKGSIANWIQETRQITFDIYAHTQKDQNLGYGYRYRYMNIVREQLQKGGLRLAALLNTIFK